jgi:FkbH-like protein
VQLSAEDLARAQFADVARQQRQCQANFADLAEYLRQLRMRLSVTGLNESNRARVVQLLAKSNQFNLTTRRHGHTELEEMLRQGGRIGVFAYEDAFGSQGIISVVVLVPEEGGRMRVDTWVMSCRVLNRTVEQAVCCWMMEQAAGGVLTGEYIPTEKNGIVADLYPRLGFAPSDAADGQRRWWSLNVAEAPRPEHYATITCS